MTLRNKILKIINANYRAGTPELINVEVASLLKSEDVVLSEGRILQKELELIARNSFAKSRLAPISKLLGAEFLPIESQQMLAKSVHDSIAESKAGLEENLYKAVNKALVKQMPLNELVTLINRQFNRAEHYARTIARTARVGRNRGNNLSRASNAGVVWFRYDGPAGTSREFCAARQGKIYHISEIEQMQNGFGLPVLLYCGGWNCRHFWTAMPDYEPEIII